MNSILTKSRIMLRQVFLIMITAATVHSAAASDYSITRVDIIAEIRDDGSVDMTETRIFEFDGTFSFAQLKIARAGFDEIGDFSVMINGSEVPRDDENREPGSYSLTQDRNFVYIRWNFSAENEQKELAVTYNLTGALPVDGGWASFNWTYLGPDHQKPYRDIHIEVRIPEEAGTDELWTWSRNKLEDESLIVGRQEITFTAAHLPTGSSLKLQTVFPSRLTDSTVDADMPIDPAKLNEEHLQWEQRQARLKAFEPWADAFGIVLILLSIFSTWYFVKNFGPREYESTAGIPSEIPAPPSDHKPAIIGWLMYYKTVSTHHLSATMLDLSRRGYFQIKQDETPKGFFQSSSDVYLLEKTDKQPDDLEKWEQELYDFLTRRIDAGKNKFTELFSSSESSTWLTKWTSNTGKVAAENNWIVYQPKVIFAHVAVQAGLFLSAFAVIAYGSSSLYGVMLFITTLFGFMFSFMLMPRTEEGEQLHRKWKAYGKALQNKSVSTDEKHKGLHLVYAVALGLSTKQFESLTQSLQFQPGELTWLILMPGATFNPAQISAGISASITSVSGSVSASTGASVGSAGGGGGSSAG